MAPLIGLGKKKEKLEGHLPLMDLVIFTVVANVSIISLNTSLMVNSVAFYQIAKLGIIPFTATVEATFFGVQKDLRKRGGGGVTELISPAW